MSTKVKVASATFKKEGDGRFGKWYLYDIKLDGDDKTYQYMGKSNPQNKFAVGQEVEVEIEKKENNGYTNWSIKPVQQGGFNGGNNGARLELDRKIGALNAAIQLVGGGHVKLEDLKKTYDRFLTEYLT
jgi:hypothetical protein